MHFETCFQYTFSRETKKDDPDYVSEDQSDLGGITKYGISLRFLKSLDSDALKKSEIYSDADAETIRHLTVHQSKNLYKNEFFDKADFDSINSQTICAYIFDMSFHMGLAPAVKCAQRAVWSVLNRRMILLDDGIMGHETIELINKTSIFLMAALRSERACYYRMTVQKNPDQQKFLTNWLTRAYTK